MTEFRHYKVGLNSKYRLQWEEQQQAYVLLYPEGMITLNGSAAEILKHCDGQNTIEEIVNKLQQQYPEAELAEDIKVFIQEAHENGWLDIEK